MKKILIFLLPGFELMEFSPFIDVFGWNHLLGSKDIEVETASFEKTVLSSWGQKLEVNKTFLEIRVEEYEALILPGGFGKYGYFSYLQNHQLDPSLYSLFKSFQEKNSYILGICTASIYLAASKLFSERNMTTYLLEEGRYFKQLSFYGSKASPQEIVKDKKLWTSSSPATSIPLAFDLLKELSSEENCNKLFSFMGFHDRIEKNTKQQRRRKMKIEKNKVVTLEFKVYDRESKELLEDTQDVGPFMYIQGIGAFVPKVEEFLEGKEKGFKGSLDLDMEDAYGDYDEDLIEEMSRADFDEFDDIYEGMEFIAEMDDGSELIYTVTEVDGDKIVTDGNHPFSGRNLSFEVFVTGVREASAEELEHGHVHFHGFED